MDRTKKIELLKSIAAGKVAAEILQEPWQPTADELLRFKEVTVNVKGGIPVSEEDRVLGTTFHDRYQRISLSHLSFEELHYIKYRKKPNEYGPFSIFSETKNLK